MEDYAAKNKIDISKVDRPCIIDGQIADTSFLAQFETTYRAGLDLTGQAARTKDTKWCKDKGMIPGTSEYLDRIYSAASAEPESSGEVEEDVQESGATLESLKEAFPKGSEKFFDAALKTIDYLDRRRGETVKTRDLQSGVASLKTQSADKVKKFLSDLAGKGFVQVLKSEDGKETYAAIESTDNDDFNW